MLNGLKLINLPPSETVESAINDVNVGNVFVLRTCQRTLLLGFNEGPGILIEKVESHLGDMEALNSFHGPSAYEFLLETICGLKSRILGENEIVHQFKEAYTRFLKTNNPNRHVQNILEKLFKDAKNIRTKHLRELGLQTYAGIVRKILIDQLAGTSYDTPVLILGSGQLAQDIIKICYRKFNITVSARNTEKVDQLKSEYPIKSLDWFSPQEISKYPIIINTIGTKETLFDQAFFTSWDKHQDFMLPYKDNKLFICLAEPSPLESSFGVEQGLWRLQDIFEQGEKPFSKT